MHRLECMATSLQEPEFQNFKFHCSSSSLIYSGAVNKCQGKTVPLIEVHRFWVSTEVIVLTGNKKKEQNTFAILLYVLFFTPFLMRHIL